MGVVFKTSSRSGDKFLGQWGPYGWGLFTPLSFSLNQTRICSATKSSICHAEEAACMSGVLKG